jgi:predicted NUDIX family NTP pyrophosphohydrolase
MPQHSAGLLVYRTSGGELEVLLVHPGGPFYRKKDAGIWSIPKGLFDPDEPALTAAKREFLEETGHELDAPDTAFLPLGELRQRSGKIVHAWAVAAELDAAHITSNSFELEWPPNSGQRQAFPEVDAAGWFPLPAAAEKILPGQRPFLDRLAAALGA